MASKVFHGAIISTFVVSGSLNTLSTKWADESTACGLEEPCDPDRKFDHPFVQACGMFIGESICFFVYWIWRYCTAEGRESIPVPVSKWFLFIIPSILDLCATSIMYIALNLTYASSFQMLRGSVVVFTGLLSVAFLGRTIRAYMWVGIAMLTVGLIMIGVGDIIFSTDDSHDPNGVVSGDLLIILSQIIVAVQVTYEEKYVRKHSFHPLLVVGLEGMSGFTILVILMAPMYFIPASKPFTNNPGHLENALDAFAQMGQNWQIIVATIGNILSIAVFNYCGITITKEISSTTRQVLDSTRTLIVWVVSLAVHWQPFDYRSLLLQLAGFVLLFVGMMIYENLVFRPYLIRHHCLTDRYTPVYNRETVIQRIDDEDGDVNNADDDELLLVP